jgi:hypothetical protein
MPDQAFAIDEQLYRRLGRRFEPELALWGASDDIHMVMIATFGVSVPAFRRSWSCPDAGDAALAAGRGRVREAAPGSARRREPRSFVKGLRYNLGAEGQRDRQRVR